MKDIVSTDKKRDKGGGGVNIGEDLIGIFTPINYDSSHPNIIEDSFGKFYLEINGNIRNNKYFHILKILINFALLIIFYRWLKCSLYIKKNY